MLTYSSPLRGSARKRRAAFTLVELLTVMGIIAILAALVLYAAAGLMQQASRSRSKTEVVALSTALENYKTDNGIYPQNSLMLTTTPYTSTDGSVSGGLYWQSSQTLYSALSGQINYLDPPVAGVKSYMSFKINELGNTSTAANTPSAPGSATYVRDPWNYSYGYSTGTVQGAAKPVYPYNGNGFFDLWSTGGTLTGSNPTAPMAVWIANFPTQ